MGDAPTPKFQTLLLYLNGKMLINHGTREATKSGRFYPQRTSKNQGHAEEKPMKRR
jgi:hypothetical protein